MNKKAFFISKEVDIYKFKSLFHQELASTYKYSGEIHDFWEIIYIDKGKINGFIGEKPYPLSQGEALIIEPNIFHNLWVEDNKSANIINISFNIEKEVLKNFSKKVIKLSDFHKEILRKIIEESRRTFSGSNNLWIKDLWSGDRICNKEDFASEDLIKNYLEIFIVELSRKIICNNRKKEYSINEKVNNEDINNMLKYMNEHIDSNLTIKDISTNFHVCETTIKQMFKKYFNMGVIEYFRNMKIEQAKIYIREGKMNFTEISQRLGYSSIHHFSKQFSKIVKMSPREYNNILFDKKLKR